MQKTLIAFVTGTSMALLASAAIAQQPAPMPTPIIEIFACTFRANNDMADLTAVTARWNTWADRNNVNDYTAFIATPYLRSVRPPVRCLVARRMAERHCDGRG